jgi:hypothetical protein
MPMPTIDENPTGPAPDPSLIDLPPGCFTPPSSPTADMPISAGAMDYPGPADSQSPSVQADAGTLADILPSLSATGCFSPGDGEAGPSPGDFTSDSSSPGSATSSGSGRSGTFSDCVRNPLPRLTINPGDSHRLLHGLLDTAARKMDRVSIDHAQREVRRVFDLYQANRRVLFRSINGGR